MTTASCGEHHEHEWEQTYGGGNDWCDAGMSGAHLTFWIVRGCTIHIRFQQIRPTGKRFCPGGCAWSRQTVEVHSNT